MAGVCKSNRQGRPLSHPHVLNSSNWYRPKAVGELIAAKGLWYWLRAAVVFGAALYVSHYVYEVQKFRNVSVSLFQAVTEWLPRQSEPRYTWLVLIEDDEYWGELSGRRPIKRDYLARIVDRLVDANAHVIALDFDMRLPNDTGTIPPEYLPETNALIDSIRRAALQGKKVVLSTPLSHDGQYKRDRDVYQAMGLCQRGTDSSNKPAPGGAEDLVNRNVSCGYIALPYDYLAIPGRLHIRDEAELDSFSLAIARARNAGLVRRLETAGRVGSNDRYGSFIPEKKFRSTDVIMRAGELLGGSPRSRMFEANIVIVGGDWSSQAAGRGRKIDLHESPVGPIAGALLHANYVEAILDDRTFSETPKWILHAIEMLFGLISGVVFAALLSTRAKIVGFGLMISTVFVAQWILMHQWATHFDALFPVAGLAIHSVCERLMEPKGHEA